jgi:UDP-N-acetylmuramoylalanine-D-glutamate ligase
MSRIMGLRVFRSISLGQWGLYRCRLTSPVSSTLPTRRPALAVAIELGVDPVLAADRLLTVRPSAGRGAVFKRSAGGRVVDDSYNANPAAVRAAVDVLAREPVFRVLILGPMLELGDTSAQLAC